MPRFLYIALFVGIGLSINIGWAAPQQDLEELRQRIKDLQQQLAQSEESKNEAADALRKSEKAISDRNRKLFELAKRIREVDVSLRRLEDQKQELVASTHIHQNQIGKLLYQRYTEGYPTPLKLFLSGESPQKIARQLYYYSYISRARLQLVSALTTKLATLQDVTQQTKQQRTDFEALKTEQIEEKKELDRERQERQNMLAQMSSQIKKQRNEINTLRRDENRLAKLIKNLNRMFADRKDAKGLNNSKLPDSSFEGTPFKEMKGKLALPVIGEINNRFGASRAGSNLLWKGLLILAKSGQDVKAVAGGRVVYSDWLRGFGNLLILDHGDNYMSLYGNNETLYKQVGEIVRAGETIATVGNSGGNAESGLYFELRHQGEAFDPLSWVNVK